MQTCADVPTGDRQAIREPDRSQERDMSFFEESRWQPAETLSSEELAYYRDILKTHANDPVAGECVVCRRPGCPDWRYAYDHLAAAGELMTEPEQWPGHSSFGARR